MVTTEMTQPIPVRHAGKTVRAIAIATGLAAAFLAGILAKASTSDGLTRTGWDLARAGAIACSIVAVLAALTYWGVEQVTERLGERADRNHHALLAVGNDQAVLSRTVSYAATNAVATHHELVGQVVEMTSELARMRGRLDATLLEQNELLQKLSQRLAVDAGIAYDLGAQSVRD